MLLKEAQQEDTVHRAQPGAPAAYGGPQMDAAWTTVVQSIGARLNHPGTNQQLGSQVSATVQLLRDLLVQLSVGDGGPAAAAASSTSTSSASSPPASASAPMAADAETAPVQRNVHKPETSRDDGPQPNVRRTAAGGSASDVGNEAGGAGERERSPRPRAGTSRFRQQRGHGLASPHLGAADDAIAAAGSEGTTTGAAEGTTMAASGTGSAEVDGASSRAEPAAAAAAAQVQEAAQEMDETDADDVVSDSGEDDAASAIAMDLDNAIAEVPQSQRRAKMREILSRRRKGTKGPTGLRKPGPERGAASDPKKPARELKD